MPKDAVWLLPGLQVKRWFALIFIGSILIALGVMIIFNMRPIYFTLEFIRKFALKAPSGVVALSFVGIGAILFFKGWQKTGLSMLHKGIKKVTNNITAVVTVGDDGGSSGRLREEMGILPPGDIRNCIAALADDEDLVTKLFQYRFKTGEGLGGHSFGNLFLSALCAITGDMVNAVKESSKVLSIRGRVLPSTLDDMRLVAQMEDGALVKGESTIPE